MVATVHRSISDGSASKMRPMIFSVSPPLYASAVSSSTWPASRKVSISSRDLASPHSSESTSNRRSSSRGPSRPVRRMKRLTWRLSRRRCEARGCSRLMKGWPARGEPQPWLACIVQVGHVTLTYPSESPSITLTPRRSRASMACAIVSALATARPPAGMRPRTRRTPRARPIRPPNPVSFGAPRAPSTIVNNRRELPALARAAGGDGDEALDETLDVDAVMKEITDTSQLGQRDEAFFVGQMVLVLLVAFPPFHVDLGDDAKFGDPLFGLATIALAAVLLVQGSKNLGNSLTPFPKPRADNKLKTSGAYAVVRHPMYSGLIRMLRRRAAHGRSDSDAVHDGARRFAQRQGGQGGGLPLGNARRGRVR